MLKSYVFKRREKNQAENKCADLAIRDFQSLGKTKLPRGPGASTQGESNPGQKGLRDRNSPICTLSQNGYGDKWIAWFLYPFFSVSLLSAFCFVLEILRPDMRIWAESKDMLGRRIEKRAGICDSEARGTYEQTPYTNGEGLIPISYWLAIDKRLTSDWLAIDWRMTRYWLANNQNNNNNMQQHQQTTATGELTPRQEKMTAKVAQTLQRTHKPTENA